MRKSDIFLLSSISEGLPNVILEAMAQGLLIISTDCLSGPLEVLNDNEPVDIPPGDFVVAKYGILVNVDDRKAMAKAIDFVAVNKNAQVKLRKAALEKVKSYQPDEIVKKVIELIG
ncbi:MAG: glycosyltransferase [Tannerellaceae bacterium]|nr:glycosyltransferase [Tannerellaceae bacterium]